MSLSFEKKRALLDLFSRDELALIDYGEGRTEEHIADRLQTILRGILTVRRHHPVRTARGLFLIDVYLEELNLAIEIDEPQHRRTAGIDADRERAIREVLGCEFMRVAGESDLDSRLNSLLKEWFAGVAYRR